MNLVVFFIFQRKFILIIFCMRRLFIGKAWEWANFVHNWQLPQYFLTFEYFESFEYCQKTHKEGNSHKWIFLEGHIIEELMYKLTKAVFRHKRKNSKFSAPCCALSLLCKIYCKKKKPTYYIEFSSRYFHFFRATCDNISYICDLYGNVWYW